MGNAARLAAAMALACAGGCFVGGSGAGKNGGKGTGGGASGTVMIGGTQINNQIEVKAAEAPKCRKDLDAAGVPYDQRSFIVQVQNGNLAAVRAFLDCGMDVETRDPDQGMTALAWAAATNATEVVRLLIDRHADVEGRARRDRAPTPLLAAVAHGHGELAGLLLGKGADARVAVGADSPLAMAAERGDGSLVQALIAAGADARGPQGGDGLRRAAAAGQLEAVRALVSAGADVNAADEAGETPLFYAARKDQIAIGCFLLASGADPKRLNHAGDDAFEDQDLSVAAFKRQYCK